MTDTKRVLIYRLGSLGDMLIALPALHLIARAFPHAERRMLTNFPVNVKAPPAAAILEHTGLVHGFLRYAVGTRSPRQLMALWWQVKRWRPEVLVYLGSQRGVATAKRDAAFFRLCGVRQLIGVPIAEEMQQNLWQEEEQAHEPEAARLVRNIQELGDARLDAPESWDLHLTPEERAAADYALAAVASYPLVAVSVGRRCSPKTGAVTTGGPCWGSWQRPVPDTRLLWLERRRRAMRASSRPKGGERLAAAPWSICVAGCFRGRARLLLPGRGC